MTKKSKGDIIWETWDHFWQQTSIAGVSNAGKATHSFRRTVWLLIFTIFLVATLCSLKLVVEDILDYPVETAVTIEGSEPKERFTFVRFRNGESASTLIKINLQHGMFKIAGLLSFGDGLQPKQG